MAQPADDGAVARLAALAARQRAELHQLRREAAARSTIDLARGILMERLGCSAAQASAQITRIADATGTDRTGLAPQIAGLEPASPGAEPPVEDPSAAPPGHPGLSPPAPALTDAAAELPPP